MTETYTDRESKDAELEMLAWLGTPPNEEEWRVYYNLAGEYHVQMHAGSENAVLR